MVDIPRCVDVVFPSDQVDFLPFDGDLDGFGAGHVGTAALDVLRDDLETLVLGSGQDVGADSLEREGDPVEGRVVRISRGSADGWTMFVFNLYPVLILASENFAAVGHSLPGFVPHGSEQTWALFRRYTGTIWCHVCSLVVAFVTDTPVHQHVTVTDHLPPVQFTGLTTGRHTFSVHLVLGTDDLLLTTLLATGKRTV